MNAKKIRIGLAQIEPVWLDRIATTQRILDAIGDAQQQSCRLLVFGEALLPGYPFWLSNNDGARFESPLQQAWHAKYLEQAVCIEAGDLNPICEAAKKAQIGLYLGIVERPQDRSGHSLYCSLVYINPEGQIGSVHRKLMPTYEERLCWGVGDGAGLVAHSLDGFTLGGLNCWENWMPLARSALYAQGVNLHVAVWPGSRKNTEDITRFIAKESRSFVVSVSALQTNQGISDDLPEASTLKQQCPEWIASGGSCVASPNGDWLLEPQDRVEAVFSCELDLSTVLKARQNFDPSGHYSRPDVTKLLVNRQRNSIADFTDIE